ncbi:hypothetical protein [Micromonospora sp. 067-2]|uniref:hypothetical protein n=1 Tax=Micromonospora sp. 067-2 TaxID=2789270 RepID=UPI00397BD89F
MTDLFTSSFLPTAMLHVGQAVHVNARAAWLPATVTSLTLARVGVDYRISPPPGSRRAELVAPWAVRPADGVCLRPVRELRAGDDVLAFDGTTRTVAAVWPRRDRWWVISHADGAHAVVSPTAVLRLTDPTPTVSVHGIPLSVPGTTS